MNSLAKPNFQLQIVIPSIGNENFLRPLLNSIKMQNCSFEFQVSIAYTCNVNKLKAILAPYRKYFQILLISSPSSGIGTARNIALTKLQTPWVLFIDEDCILPHENYLQQIERICQDTLAVGYGGYYASKACYSYWTKSYNHLCNAWVNNQVQKKQKNILGGCGLYSLNFLNKNQIRFGEESSVAGEELQLNQRILSLGGGLLLKEELNILHNPQVTMSSFCKKIEVQSSANIYENSSHNRLTNFINYSSYFIKKPMYAPAFFVFLIIHVSNLFIYFKNNLKK